MLQSAIPRIIFDLKNLSITVDTEGPPSIILLERGKNKMAFDEEKFEHDAEKTVHMLAIREAFLKIEGVFDCMDIYKLIKKEDLVEQIPVDRIADALERFTIKGELEVVKQTPPKKYRRIIQPIN